MLATLCLRYDASATLFAFQPRYFAMMLLPTLPIFHAITDVIFAAAASYACHDAMPPLMPFSLLYDMLLMPPLRCFTPLPLPPPCCYGYGICHFRFFAVCGCLRAIDAFTMLFSAATLLGAGESRRHIAGTLYCAIRLIFA